MSVDKWNSGIAPGISAARLNEPFQVISAVYDAVDDEIDVLIGRGRAQNGNGVVDLNTLNTTLYITSPSVSTTYYIFYNSDGTFTFSTTQKPVINTVILASVTSADPLGNDTTIVDLRNLLPPAAFPKSIYDADGDTGYEVERTADSDTHNWKVADTDAMDLNSSGLRLGTGDRITDFTKIFFPRTQVYNTTPPSSMTDLDLSAVVGSKESEVLLRVEQTTSGAVYLIFRKNGETGLPYISADIGDTCIDAIRIDIVTTGYFHVLVTTDSSGKIEWQAGAAAGIINIIVERVINI